MVRLWNISIQEDSVHSCDPADVEEATAFPSEEDNAIREWRQEFPEQTRRAISRIHTKLGHPQNSTLAKVISHAGGNDDMIVVLSQFRELDSAMIPVGRRSILEQPGP